MNTSLQNTGAPESGSSAQITCPAWCADHNQFSDGSDNWHESRTVEVHGFEFYVSTGTLTGEPELFMPQQGCKEGMALEEAAEVAQAVVSLIREVRS